MPVIALMAPRAARSGIAISGVSCSGLPQAVRQQDPDALEEEDHRLDPVVVVPHRAGIIEGYFLRLNLFEHRNNHTVAQAGLWVSSNAQGSDPSEGRRHCAQIVPAPCVFARFDPLMVSPSTAAATVGAQSWRVVKMPANA
jgi:hypothetical protein